MVTLIKKASCSLLLLGVLFFNFGASESNAAELTGKISFYLGQGSLGSDGKVLTKNDVAVSYANRNLPKGTPILTTNTAKNIKRTLYKWDYGGFGNDVILDVQKAMYTEMGGVISAGYFPGHIKY
ncbi:hypothetical protein ABE021_09175 [Sporosarcina gallistercoris]|uniref:hypothetical protein n=1 Tax=Sporosarcina gallistercoris TaxID=2762245 RepID=UPI003D2D2E11